MHTRASILGASVCALLLTVAPAPPSADHEDLQSNQRKETAIPNSCKINSQPRTGPTNSPGRLNAAYAPGSPRPRESAAPPINVDAETLWLARAIYSETKLPHEQELVAWVVRNRVETGYRGSSSYRDAVLDPYQFSAFNPGTSKRSFLMGLGPETPLGRWQQALWVAHYVRHADPVYRPFSIETRHFYSERSMDGRRAPYWADGTRFVSPEAQQYSVDEQRFRFFEQIS